MSNNTDDLSKEPTPDQAEDNAFFPSPYSLSQYTQPRTDFDGVKHEGAYTEGRWKVLMIATEERYVLCENGKMFSTGNHPVEMLLPLHHLMAAGFDVDVATIAGYPAKLELWAMPGQDQAVLQTYEALKPKLKQPKKLAEVVANDLGADSDYLAVFIPGGHGAVVGLPAAEAVAQTLNWALANDKFIITLCHGPAALLSVGQDGNESPFKGYSVCVFPDALDQGPNIEIGYLPGHLQWLVADLLGKQGLTILNDDMTGKVHQDRKLLTGDSPLASNGLGLLAADVLVEAVQSPAGGSTKS
ncbi:protein deglycase HchA [Mycolicibacterium goodii]|uniref:glyoxalase III HchA n=1 Tax=Mycolicibacterium goodii TaxID=134601 RepID=UPI000C268ABD|nr:glyoxalase III HchA [Mycolicibacterium goodii]MBU8812110.1 protein deglycase HchA [Mycolicibacterium goodii]PJK20151.1 protein deglycase HchA [Mycolicibacterium goodii]ULN49679.1 protein deglycase HchA [Mycolicibacterium goodii]